MKSFRYILLIALFAMLHPEASAQTPPKIDFEKYTLANGLQVVLHVDKKIPAVNVNLWYHVGSKNEQPGKTGFAHLFEHMMFQGSKHVKGEYLALAERAGANLRTGGVNGTTNEDRTNYFETVPTTSLEYALWLESDRMGFLDDVLTQEAFANQQDVVKNEKRQGDNSPYSVIDYLIADHLYPQGHPYAHTVIGSIEDLTNASLDDVRDFFNTWYVPNNCTLTLSGDFEPAEAKRLVQKYFGPLAPGQPLSRPGVNIPVLARTKQVHAKDRVPLGRLELVYATPPQYSPEEAPLDAVATILGQGKTSLLYKKLVRELELANRVTVWNSCREISGEFHIVVTAREGVDLNRIRDVVDEQISALLSNGPDSDELDRFKAQSAMSFISGLERIGGFGGVADKLNAYNTYLGTPDYFLQDYSRYQQITAADVMREFKAWVAEAKRLEIYITPETSTRPDAEEFDRSIPPALQGAVAFVPPVIETETLDNGLQILVSHRGDMPVVTARLIIKSQDVLESEEKAGRSSLTASMLDEGTATRDAVKIQEDLDRYGASLNVNGSKTGANVSLSTLSRYIDQTFEIMADVVLNPSFPEEDFERMRRQTLESIKQQKSNPSAMASHLFNRLLYGEKHPMGRSSTGTVNSVTMMSTQDLRETWNTYWRPNNAALVFVGDITIEQATALSEKYFSSWKFADVPAQEIPATTAPAKHVVYLFDKQDAPQSEIRIGSIAPARTDPEYYPLQLTNALLGGAFSARLNLNLREDKGYTYGAFCTLMMAKGFGSWSAAAGVQSKFTKESLVEFRKEIEGIGGAIPVTQQEIRNMQDNLTRGYVQNFESSGMVVNQIAPLVSYGLPLTELEAYLKGVEQQTTASVTGMAKKHYRFNNGLTVIAGDLSVIEKAARELKWGKVYVVDDEGKVLREIN